MKKILHLITGLEVGGAEMALTRTLPELKSFEHAIAGMKGRGGTGAILENQKFRVYYLNPDGKFRFFDSIGKFKKIIAQEKPDLIITYLPLADIFGRIFGRIFGVKKIVSYIRSRGREPKYFPIFLADFLTSFLVTKYLAISETVRQFYIRRLFINPSKIAAIPNGVDTEKFKPAPKRQTTKQEIAIGTVSQLRKEKRIDFLIRAFAKACEETNNLKLVIAGRGAEETNLKNTAQELGISKKVEFLGQREDIPQLLQTFDIFVMPSLYEGMSNAILEAMATSCAVVVSDIPENRDIISDRRNGLLIPPTDADSFSKSIIKLSENEKFRKELGEKARQEIKNRFNQEKIAKILKTEIEKILNSHN